MLLPILLSLLGFVAILLVDWQTLRGAGLAGWLAPLLAGAALLLAAYWLALQQPDAGLGLPQGAAPLGWVLAVAGGALLIYSVFIEIPLIQRRQARAQGAAMGPRLVTTGTYALSRHPGFLWLLLCALGLILLWNRVNGLALLAWWLLLDLIVILIQDRVIFPRVFPGYAQYQAVTPMLIPTPSSIRRAWMPHRGERS